MAQTDIASAERSALGSAIDDYSVDSVSLDGAGDQKETTYQNSNFTQQLGYYKKIPELKIALDTKAKWTTGNGFMAEETTTMLLDTIKGWGKDTFISILESLDKTSDIGGDAFAEIITDDDDVLINLKPLDPSIMVIVADRQGRIKRYEQTSKHGKKKPKRFEPEQIFHLTKNRVGDEIHGVSVIDSVEDIILMRNEAMADYKQLLHWFVKPRWIFHLDTDDTAKITAFKAKMDKANATGDNMYIPKGAVVPELMAVAPNSTLDPKAWIESLNDYFYETVGVPKVVIGNSKNFTDASSKIVYLTWEQRVKEAQLYIEEQVLSQLNIVIELVKPALLENEVLAAKPTAEERGEEPEEPAAQPNDTTAELEGKK